MKLISSFIVIAAAVCGCGSAGSTDATDHGPQSDGGINLPPQTGHDQCFGDVFCPNGTSSSSSSSGAASSGAVSGDDGPSSSTSSGGSSSGVGDDSGSSSSSSSSGGGLPGDDAAIGDSATPESATPDTGTVVDACNGGKPDAAVCVAPTCTFTQGYYKQHPSPTWPVLPVVMGGVSYDEVACLALLNEPSVANASVVLAKQLIAAIENNGQCDPAIAQTIAAAMTWMSVNRPDGGTLPYNILIPSVCDSSNTQDTGCAAMSLGQTLDQFNSGVLSVPHCN